jgi:predicted DsbA family dithiol-disulfide isomerase
MFRAYFKEGRDISDVEVLADLADTCGMDAALIQRLLATDEDLEGVREKDAGFRKMGVNSVPTFIIAGQHAVPGAQSPEMWRKVIADIKAQLNEEA